MNNQDI